MKSTLTCNIYQFLASATHGQKPSKPSLQEKLIHMFRSASAYFTAGSEPYVWETTNAAGYPQWNAYDPTTRTAIEGVSEAELRIWLEERHYQYHCSAH
ncbi:hypothetical protein [Altericista sp. CCNU0014]|uniref:hypothetical protein n=1 Tax=Altericista sp. CCNU0014 TaxID=3082949 RepID=UPI00384CAD55